MSRGGHRRAAASIDRVSQVSSTLEERASASTNADGRRRPADSNGDAAARHGHPAGAALAAPRRPRALALPRAPRDARLARHRRPLQADVPRHRLGDPRPVFTALVYIVVFGKFADFPSGGMHVPGARDRPASCRCSTSPPSLTGSSMSLVANLQLVTKVYFPRVLLPLAAVIVPAGRLRRRPPGPARRDVVATRPGRAAIEVLFAPLFLALALVTALGLGFFLSALNVRYRDVRYMIPVFLQVLPLLSGVMYAVESIPEKWQWILAFNPMTAVISGWRWAVVDATAARSAARSRVERRRRARPVRRRSRRLPLVRAALRGHDLMAVAIEAEGLSKRYRIGELQAAYGTLRESLAHAATRLIARKEHKLTTRGDLGARGRLLRGRGGRGARRHRPQRRRQVDAAQGPDAHHDADRGARRRSAGASAACSRSAPASIRS